MSNQSSSSDRWAALIRFLITAFGIPSGVIAGIGVITKNPWLVAIIVSLYYVLLLIVNLAGKIWKKLEDLVMDRIAEWVKYKGQDLFFHYQRHYCQLLVYQHRDFDVKGLSTQGTFTLDLVQVFVELHIAPTPAHHASPNPIRLPSMLTEGRSIWDYLAAEPLKSKQFVILGAPGSGKTTLLKHLTLMFALRQKRYGNTRVPYKLPFLLFLKDFAPRIQDDPDCSLTDVIQQHLQRVKHPAPIGWAEGQLKRGQCIILLDGLDEVTDTTQRVQIIKWVQQQIEIYGNNRFVLTSRPFGYRDNPLSGVATFEIQPFSSEQITCFISNWYLANECMSSGRNDPRAHMKAKEGAQDLLQRLWKMPALSVLAVNPLSLTMMTTVHRYRSALPNKRIDLYAEICEVFLGKRQEARGITLELNASQKRRVLQPLAYQMMVKRQQEVENARACQLIEKVLETINPQMTTKSFFALIEQTSGLVLEREVGKYGFAHLTFQEYLAAVHVKEEGLEHELVQRVRDDWWHETIRLYCALADATEVIKVCLNETPPSVPGLKLALECQGEAFSMLSSVRAQLDKLLNEGMEDVDLERRKTIAEFHLARRVQQMAQVNETLYRDSSLLTCGEYQVFLDEQPKALSRRPDHWETNQFPSSIGYKPLLGIRPSDATVFCKWLTQWDQEKWYYRLPYTGELNEKDHEIIRGKTSDQGLGYWSNGGKAFTWLTEPPSSLHSILHEMFILDHTRMCISILMLVLNFASDLALNRNNASSVEIVCALEYILNLSRTIDLALVQVIHFQVVHKHSLEFIKAIDLALKHARSLINMDKSMNDIPLDLFQIMNIALTHVGKLTHTSSVQAHIQDPDPISSAINVALKHARSLFYDLGLEPDLFQIIDIVRTIDLTLKHASSPSRDLISTYNEPTLNQALDFFQSREYVLNLIRIIDLANALNLDFGLDRPLNLDQTYNSVRVLKHTCKLPADFENDFKVKSFLRINTFLRLRIRLSALVLVLCKHHRPKSALIMQDSVLRYFTAKRNKTQGNSMSDEFTTDSSLDLYRDMALLELRIQGKIPLWEAILLVKERKHDHQEKR